MHGGMHASWCWDKVGRALRALGYDSIAPDLPGHGARAEEPCTLGGYRQALLDLLEPGDVLVGHSLGGTAITLAADAAQPTGIEPRRLIYLAAPVPAEGRSLAEIMPFLAGNPAFVIGPTAYSLASFRAAREVFYHDCPPADAAWAYDRVHAQPLAPLTERVHLPHFWDSSVPRDYIVCLDDRSGQLGTVEPSLNRLGIETAYPLWSSHMPLLSRPDDLARLLVRIAVGAPGPGVG